MQKYEEVEGIDTSTVRGSAIRDCQVKYRGLMGGDLVVSRLLDFINIMGINNKFASRGIYISDDNREESYIKIIELGEDGLIDDLEEYINKMDSLKKIMKVKGEYEEIVEKIKSLDEIDDYAEIKKLTLKYTRR